MERTLEELRRMQALPFEQKLKMTKERIKEWYDYWDGNVYVSFSGGKDSTVLLHIVRSLYPDVEAVYSDTGLEYPEIKKFVRTFENVTIIKPTRSFRQVVLDYGYPVASKEISRKVYYYKRGSDWANKYFNDSLMYNGKPSQYRVSDRWKRLVDAPFEVSPFCCDVMKKQPIHKYEKESGKKAIIGAMAEESAVRTQAWERTGCNAFEMRNPHSNPMSFWTEQDVITYLLTYQIPYCSVYGEIVNEDGKYRFTGVSRTGCMFCMFGVHMEKEPNRFQRMKVTHPIQYEYCMKPVSEGGLGLKEILDYINVPY